MRKANIFSRQNQELIKVYESAMAVELKLRNISYEIQIPVSVIYKGVKVQSQVLDMVVEQKLLLEFKSVKEIAQAHKAQVISYLKSTKMPVGLLINFGADLVKDGIKRFVNTWL